MKYKQLPQASQKTHNIQVHTRLSKSQSEGQNLILKCSASNLVFLVNLQVPWGTQESPPCLFILVKRGILPVENRWSIFRSSALPERWEAQNDRRALALRTSAHAPPAAFSLEQVCTASRSFCASRFLSAASSSLPHLTWQLEIFPNLTWQQESWQGKAAQQPHLVLCTSDYAQCPASTSSTRASLPSHTMQAQHRLTLLFPYHFFQVQLSKVERIRTGQEMTCTIPAQPLQHATPALAAQLRKAVPHSHQEMGNSNLCSSAKLTSNTFPTVPNCKALLPVCLSLYHTLTVTLGICCRSTIESCSW